jgi:phenylpyruvate tautomerase PptA (4-oxalocrotonate tautomerase family)
MPNIVVKVPSGLLSAEAKAALVKRINAAAAECERIPADPKKRFLCWVLIEEVAAGNWTCGGVDMSQMVIPIVAIVNLPAGVLADASRARYVNLMHRAFVDALPGERRQIATSCIINEVADGMWGASGYIWHLPQFAAAAGYEHLQHLVAQN